MAGDPNVEAGAGEDRGGEASEDYERVARPAETTAGVEREHRLADGRARTVLAGIYGSDDARTGRVDEGERVALDMVERGCGLEGKAIGVGSVRKSDRREPLAG